MTSSNGHHGYDEDLLASAPAPTKGMVQSGYATDLLVDKPKPSRRGDIESGRHRSHSSRHASIPNGAKATVDGKGASTTSIPTKVSSKTPFYRTKRGIIIIVIVAIVLLAVIIGGAVGGALAGQKKNGPSLVSTTQPAVSPTPTPGSGDPDPQAGVPDGAGSSSQAGGPVTVRVTTTRIPDSTASPRISPVSSTVLGGFSLTFTR